MREITSVARNIFSTILLCSVAALSGCWYDSSSSSSANSSAGSPGATKNSAPTIAGAPSAAAVVGQSYRFVPAVTDADGDALSFKVENLPAWASFSNVTGELYGTPMASDVGSFAGIRVSVSDGTTTSSLAAFTLKVVAAANPAASGAALLSWQPPTLNEDGTPLVGLAGYKIYYGNDASAMNQVISLTGADNTRYGFTNLATGTYYFGVAAVTSAGVESRLSGIASKTIG